jgi:multisubunit Na+/H+ antiporter MnhC subunit
LIWIKALQRDEGDGSVTTRRTVMPIETILVLTGIVAVFGGFAGMVCFADLTWQGNRK